MLGANGEPRYQWPRGSNQPDDEGEDHWFNTDMGQEDQNVVTVRPDWTAIQSGTMTEGQIILREDSAQARRVVITVRVAEDRKSLTLAVTEQS